MLIWNEREDPDPDGPVMTYQRAHRTRGNCPEWVILRTDQDEPGKAEWVCGADTEREITAAYGKYFMG